MTRILKWIIIGAVAAVGGLIIREVHLQKDVLPLTVYLVLSILYPLLVGLHRLLSRRSGFRDFAQNVFWAIGSLVVVKLARQFITQDWLVACIIGVIVPSIVSVLRTLPTLTARNNLTLANQTLLTARTIGSNPTARVAKLQEALGYGQRSLAMSIQKHDLEGRAGAEWLLGLVYLDLRQPEAARQHLSAASQAYQLLGQPKMYQQVRAALSQSKLLTNEMPTIVIEDPHLPWNFAIDGITSAALIVLLLQWQQSDPVALPFQITFAVIATVVLFGASIIRHQVAIPGRWPRIVILALSIGLTVLALTGFALRMGWLPIARFPLQTQFVATDYAAALNAVPEWAGLAAAIAFALTALYTVTRGLVVFSSGNRRRTQALQAAGAALITKDWNSASKKLNEIDIARLKDSNEQEFVLFSKAYSEAIQGHNQEAQTQLQQLFAINPRNLPGLYLVGYLALKDNRLEQAEKSFRNVTHISANFAPKGGKSARYYLALTLYRRAMAIMETDVDTASTLMTEVSTLGELDREVADAMVRTLLNHATTLIRDRQWAEARKEIEQAILKHKDLENLVENKTEVQKLKGLCHAAAGLVALKSNQFDQAAASFKLAKEATQGLKGNIPNMFAHTGQNFMEQLLRTLSEQQKGGDEMISPSFMRDVSYLSSLSQLRGLKASLNGKGGADWHVTLASVEAHLEHSLNLTPSFGEAHALLGLLYYYLSSDAKKKATGLEMLQRIQVQVGSAFVAETVANAATRTKQQEDVRAAYFDMLRDYTHAADLPRPEREALRDKVLAEMRANGQDESFVERGTFQIEKGKEHEPSVQEYIKRTALLREKLRQILTEGGDTSNPELTQRVDQLNNLNKTLENTVKAIVQAERDLLLEARTVL